MSGPGKIGQTSFSHPTGPTGGPGRVFAVGATVQGRRGLYRITGEFAAGGMGKILKVIDAGNRTYLLKVLQDLSGYDPKVQAQVKLRFANEVEAMERTNSPYVVKVIDRDVLPIPTFCVIEKIEGQDLESAAPPGTIIPQHIALLIVIHTLDGLIAFESAYQKAHKTDVRVAHRDLKPANILLEIINGDVQRVVLIDFGIAKLAGSKLTKTAMFFGTPGYCAPETIVQGGCKDADQRVDVFSLGAILYRLLTGQDAFPDAERTLASFANAPTSFIEPLQKNRPRHVSEQLWTAVFEAMSPRPDDRPRYYAEFRQTLFDLQQKAAAQAARKR